MVDCPRFKTVHALIHKKEEILNYSSMRFREKLQRRTQKKHFTKRNQTFMRDNLFS